MAAAAAAGGLAPVALSPEVISRMGIAAVFGPAPERTGDTRTNGLAFVARTGQLVSTHNDCLLRVYSGTTGSVEAEVALRASGCKLVQTTHHPSCVLHASTAVSPTDPYLGQVAYHSLEDNKIIRTFKGHLDT